MKAQKYSSRPYPNGCERSGALLARAIPYSSKPSLIVSTSECTPSLSMAELPVIAAATNLVAAIARLPPSAANTTNLDPDFDDTRVTGAARACPRARSCLRLRSVPAVVVDPGECEPQGFGFGGSHDACAFHTIAEENQGRP